MRDRNSFEKSLFLISKEILVEIRKCCKLYRLIEKKKFLFWMYIPNFVQRTKLPCVFDVVTTTFQLIHSPTLTRHIKLYASELFTF